MLNWNEFDARHRDQIRDMERAVQKERLARRVETRGISFDLQCWVMSRIDYLGALAGHWARRVGRTLPDGQPRPMLSDCQ